MYNRKVSALLASAATVAALGFGAASASAVTIYGHNGTSVSPSPLADNTTVSGSLVDGGVLKDADTGDEVAYCDNGTFQAKVAGSSTRLDANVVNLGSCFAAGQALTVTTNAPTTPWQFSATGASSPFTGHLDNWSAASAKVTCGGSNSATYTLSAAPTGFTLVNVVGGSKVVGVDVGPLVKSATTGTGCPVLPVNASLSGEIVTTGTSNGSYSNVWGV